MVVLNDTGAENVFKHLAFAFCAQTISQTVQCFDYNPKCFRDHAREPMYSNSFPKHLGGTPLCGCHI